MTLGGSGESERKMIWLSQERSRAQERVTFFRAVVCVRVTSSMCELQNSRRRERGIRWAGEGVGRKKGRVFLFSWPSIMKRDPNRLSLAHPMKALGGWIGHADTLFIYRRAFRVPAYCCNILFFNPHTRDPRREFASCSDSAPHLHPRVVADS